MGAMQISGGKNVPERSNRRCKSPEVGVGSVCLNKSQSRVNKNERKGDGVREVGS